MPSDRDYAIHGTYAELLERRRPPRFNWLGWGTLAILFLWNYQP